MSSGWACSRTCGRSTRTSALPSHVRRAPEPGRRPRRPAGRRRSSNGPAKTNGRQLPTSTKPAVDSACTLKPLRRGGEKRKSRDTAPWTVPLLPSRLTDISRTGSTPPILYALTWTFVTSRALTGLAWTAFPTCAMWYREAHSPAPRAHQDPDQARTNSASKQMIPPPTAGRKQARRVPQADEEPAGTWPRRLGRSRDRRYGRRHSTGCAPCPTSRSLARLNGREPKKPRSADIGDG